MITIEKKPSVGELYRFDYNGEERVAVVLSAYDPMQCWDFTNDGFRYFRHDKVKNFKDITKSLGSIEEYSQSDIRKARDAGCKVFEDVDNDTLYYVKFD